MAFTCTLTARNTKVTGKTISNMERVMRPGLIVASSMDTMLTQRKKARACMFGLMAINT
jgi:hypothetical protein